MYTYDKYKTTSHRNRKEFFKVSVPRIEFPRLTSVFTKAMVKVKYTLSKLLQVPGYVHFSSISNSLLTHHISLLQLSLLLFVRSGKRKMKSFFSSFLFLFFALGQQGNMPPSNEMSDIE